MNDIYFYISKNVEACIVISVHKIIVTAVQNMHIQNVHDYEYLNGKATNMYNIETVISLQNRPGITAMGDWA